MSTIATPNASQAAYKLRVRIINPHLTTRLLLAEAFNLEVVSSAMNLFRIRIRTGRVGGTSSLFRYRTLYPFAGCTSPTAFSHQDEAFQVYRTGTGKPQYLN